MPTGKIQPASCFAGFLHPKAHPFQSIFLPRFRAKQDPNAHSRAEKLARAAPVPYPALDAGCGRKQAPLQLGQKHLRRPRKHLVLFPDDIQFCFQRRRQRPEAQLTVSTGVNELGEGEDLAQALPRLNARVIGQIKGGHDVQGIHLFPEPLGKVLRDPLAGTDERQM